jgi:hypothetical protein
VKLGVKFPIYEGKFAALSGITMMQQISLTGPKDRATIPFMNYDFDSFTAPVLPIETQKMLVSMLDARPLPAPPADALMTLKAAVTLPELGQVISVKALRTAIERGDLLAFQPGGPAGTVYVTRQSIRAWISSCRVAKNPRTSISVLRNTPVASSVRARSGASSTDRRKAALVAALKTAQELKESSRNT